LFHDSESVRRNYALEKIREGEDEFKRFIRSVDLAGSLEDTEDTRGFPQLQGGCERTQEPWGGRNKRRRRMALDKLEVAATLPMLNELRLANLTPAGARCEKRMLKMLAKLWGVTTVIFGLPRLPKVQSSVHVPSLLLVAPTRCNSLAHLTLRSLTPQPAHSSPSNFDAPRRHSHSGDWFLYSSSSAFNFSHSIFGTSN
jgi:hypothetical protein